MKGKRPGFRTGLSLIGATLVQKRTVYRTHTQKTDPSKRRICTPIYQRNRRAPITVLTSVTPAIANPYHGI